MSSSFIARSLQSSSYKGREPISTSPTRKPLSSSTSSPQKDLEMAATRRNPVQRSESLSRYDVGTSSRRSTRKLRENISSPHPTATRASPKTNNGLPTRRLSGVILSPNQVSPSRRSSVAKGDSVQNSAQNSPSTHKPVEGLQTAMQIDSSSKFQENPYSNVALSEKAISPPRRPSFGDHLQNLSRTSAKPELSLSPLVPTLSTSPIVDFPDPQKDPLDNSSTKSGTAKLELLDDQQQKSLNTEDFSSGMKSQISKPGTSPPSPIPSFQSPTQDVVHPDGGGAGGMSFMTNPLYPNASAAQSTMSLHASHMDDGQTLVHDVNPSNGNRGKRFMTPEEKLSDNSLANKSQKGRMKVRETLERARSRLSQISHETKKTRKQNKTRCCGRLCTCICEILHKLSRGKGPKLLVLWVNSLNFIESNFGSSMMLVFAFLRWMFLLNSILAVLWLAAMIIPFMVHPPRTFDWMVFLKSLINKEDLKNVVQGESLDKTFVYYGGYMYQRWEQEGRYRVDYMYTVIIGATFFISYIAAMWRIAERIINGGHLAWGSQFFPFTSIVFSSWDYHITSVQAASKLRKGIQMHLKEMLADAKFKNAQPGSKGHNMSFQRFLALFILWPLLLAGNVLAVGELVKKADQINEKVGSQYAQALLLSVLNGAMPIIVRMLVGIEEFRPAIAEKVILTKLFVVRIFSVGTLFYRLYMMVRNTNAVRNGDEPIKACGAKSTCTEGFTCCTRVDMTDWHICTHADMNMCLPGCIQNEVGAQLLRLISITTLLRVVCELGYGFGYLWTSSGVSHFFIPFSRSITKPGS